MGWFKKDPPPPEPSLKSKVPGWIVFSTPIIFAIIIGLISVVYNSIAQEIKQKVDNQTLQLMIEKQDIRIQQQQDNMARQQQILDETLQEIKTLRIEQQRKDTSTQKGDAGILQLYMELDSEQRKIFKQLYPSYSYLPE